MAGRGLEQQIFRGRGCHRLIHHAVMALIQKRPSGLPGGGTQGDDLSLNRTKELLIELRAIEQEILQGIETLEGMLR